MGTNEIREKYLKFFESRGHKIIPPAPLVLANDPTTLFTSSGMQPLVPYLMGEKHPEGTRLVDSQPSIRTQDIEEVGDNRHTTFFEMLGNWSLGDYFKKEQLPWIWEFMTKDLGLPREKLYVSVFEGNADVPKDVESKEIWKSLGISGDHIFEYGVDKNWWSRSGTPEQMPEGEIGGPDSEVFYEFENVKHDPKFGKECHPNCDCGRFLEIGNSVFIEYQKKNGKLIPLSQKNVDFGGGLERMTAAVNDDPDVFKIDVFQKIIEPIRKIYSSAIYDPSTLTPYYPPPKAVLHADTTNSEKRKIEIERNVRIIADHFRAACFLAANGVEPSNKGQGYVLRRLIRRSARKFVSLGAVLSPNTINRTIRIVEAVINSYPDYFKDGDSVQISSEIGFELDKFSRTLNKGLIKIDQIFQNRDDINGEQAFELYATYGFPIDLLIEEATNKGKTVDIEGFNNEMKKHKKLSRTQSAGVFKGGLADHSEKVVRLHTATHLLHAALRKVLGEEVSQKGSNITAERLRFDFTYPKKLSEEQIKKVEDLVNKKIDEDLPVSFEVTTLEKARKEGALAFFGEKYGDKVKVYAIGPSTGSGSPFSREVCGGPHVTKLSDIGGHVRISKEGASGAGVRRIYAVIE